MRDLPREGGARLLKRIAVGFHHRDALRCLRGEVLAPAGERGNGAFLKVSDACECSLQSLSLGFVMGDGDRQRTLAALNRRRRVPDLLVQDQKSAAVDHLSLRCRSSAAD